MSVVTQLQIESLARDPSGLLVASSGALRRAENVTIRAAGVAESRPNFDLLKEDLVSLSRIKNLYEFQGEPIAVDHDSVFSAWEVRRLSTLATYQLPGGIIANVTQPVDYDAAETKFAEARQSLYFTAKAGILKVASPFITSTGLDYAGVEMVSLTDLLTKDSNFADPTYSWAYQYVFLRKDVNGYIRRSAPSERLVVTALHPVVPLAPTRVYFPSGMQIGDQVEVYRTRMTTGTSPSPEVYLSFTVTITNADKSVGYFTPPYDSTTDNQLGAALYTNPSQGTALAAKYPPPQAQAIAYFGSVMWYGRTVSKQRAALSVRSIGLGGFVTDPQLCTFDGTATVVCGSTANYRVGDSFTDNLTLGPTHAGTYVPANQTIFAILGPTTFTLDPGIGVGTGVAFAGVMLPHAPRGIASGVGSGTHTAGSLFVTGVPDTTLLTVGMGWSDAAGGPATAGTLTQADTVIDAITSPTTITISKPALSSGSGAAGYDSLRLGTTYFYFIDGTTLLGTHVAPWSWPVRCIPYWPAISGADSQLLSLLTCTAMAVNFWALTNPLFKIRAVPIGDTNLDDGEHGVIGNIQSSIVFEEIGVGGGVFYVSPSRTTAFDPTPPFFSTNAGKPNRLQWSDLNEPESVRLTNFVDVGSENFPISALVAMRDALLIFKAGDGVYRLTGSGPSNWTIDCIDPKLRLLRPEAVAVIDQVAYCWAERGFFAVTETGLQSLSAGRLDVELRPIADAIEQNADTHGTWVVAWPQRQLVLFGTPSEASSQTTGTIYCYSLVTGAFSEWPLPWNAVGTSKVDNLYYARSGNLYEAREAKDDIEGFDRSYDLAEGDVIVLTAFGVTTAVVAASGVGRWVPTVGDAFSRISHDDWRQFRRITSVAEDSGFFVMTLEAPFKYLDPTLSPEFRAHEMAACEVVIEWPPVADAGIPVGGMTREIQVQFDLRKAPPNEPPFIDDYAALIDDGGADFIDGDGDDLVWADPLIPAFVVGTPPAHISSIPYYEIGGTPETSTVPATLVSRREPRIAQIQPIRVGTSRQIARNANLAAYVKSSDIYALRVNGISLVFEGTSERTRR